MNLSPKDMLMYALIGLTLAVAVNHVAELHIPFLDKIGRAVIPESERGRKGGGKQFDYTNTGESAFGMTEKCKKRLKTTGDQKIGIRHQMRVAKSEKDDYKIRELEELLAEIEDAERQACQ